MLTEVQSAPPQLKSDDNRTELSILMPCLNEAETLATCIKKAQKALESLNVHGEVVIADNGSTDGSPEIAVSLGARVVHVAEKGYGSALLGGIKAARGKYIIMGDADDSYDFTNLGPFLEKLRAGYDLVMGNRFKGGIAPRAMPPLHRYLGNPVLTSIGRLFFRSQCGDFHCGLRGFSKAAIQRLDLRTRGMEFASETVVKASLHGLRITEVPTTLSVDGRNRPPHLRSWRDGWRHLRFLLLYSPRWLFLYPGLFLMLVGAVVSGWLLVGPRVVDGITLDVHTFLYAAIAIVIGYQTVIFAIFTKVFAITEGLLPEDPRLKSLFNYIKLETGILAGALLLVAGIGLSIYALSFWSATSFGPLDPSRTLRLVIPAVTLIALGLQTVLSSFFLSILGLERH
jgi:glycosyltransferase involved in cell wall biosynthesis